MHHKILRTLSVFATGAFIAVSVSAQPASPEQMEKVIESKVKQSIDSDRDGKLNRREQTYARQLQRLVDQDWDGKVSDYEKQLSLIHI